ncbi:MAG: inorganic phosphate transporter [Prevotella sp.]
MTTIYLVIVIFLLCLAVFDLFVGVSNDAVNFLQSAIGAKVAKFRTVLIIASFGVILGAVMSSGMMDVARHGIMNPSNFNFKEVMVIFLAVMVTDVIVLDIFNRFGMPTSTTVSLVFELLGGTFMLAVLKMLHNSSFGFKDLLNTEQALKVIIAIFVSVAIAFAFGVLVQWITRIIFTFNYKKYSRYTIAIFGGIAFTTLSYFIFMKGFGKSPYVSEDIRSWIDANIGMLLVYTFIVSAIAMEVLHLLGVNIFKFVVMMGTFALAMAFAGNDLVNFIGVPLAGLDSYQTFLAQSNGADPSLFLMTSLMESAKTPPFYLLLAGLVMVVAMATSKKAHRVIKTSVDLSRQDEGDEMFGSSFAARSLVRFTQNINNFFTSVLPKSVVGWMNSRFDQRAIELDKGASFDVVRAAVNLVLSAMLITIGTNYKLPLSTTYVTFMVAMGSSLADRAWSRESAVFRVTGVISVIGGWFITAGVAFAVCAIVSLLMFYGGIIVQALFMLLVVFQLIRPSKDSRQANAEKDDSFRLMMRTQDSEILWDLLSNHVSRTQSNITRFAFELYNKMVDGFINDKPSELRLVLNALDNEKEVLKKYRRQELLALRKAPADIAIERNTWFHLSTNAAQQYIYILRRMLEPIKEHVDNNFTPIPDMLVEEYNLIRVKINQYLLETEEMIQAHDYSTYRDLLDEADFFESDLSVIRKKQIDRIQIAQDTGNLQIYLVYLNLLQESQQLISNMRHQLRAVKKFIEN